jgi:hypothetical protein
MNQFSKNSNNRIQKKQIPRSSRTVGAAENSEVDNLKYIYKIPSKLDQYQSKSFFITNRKKDTLFLDKVVKFIYTRKKNKIKFINFSYFTHDTTHILKLYDIIVISPNDACIQQIPILIRYKYYTPLYFVFSSDYIIFTPLLYKKIQSYLDIQDTFFEVIVRNIGGAIIEGICPSSVKCKWGNDAIYELLNKIYNFKTLYLLSQIPPRVCPSTSKNIIPNNHGWFNTSTKLCLQYILKNFKYKYIVELGSWLGKSAKFILKTAAPGSKLYCFDKFQDIVQSPYDEDAYIEKKNSIQNLSKFYIHTPRFETFCKNVSDTLLEIKEQNSCYTISTNITNFIKILKKQNILADIVFIDAIKKKIHLIEIIYKIYEYNPEVVIVGDDYIYKSVQQAINEIRINSPNLNIYITAESYIITKHCLQKNKIDTYINKYYYPAQGQHNRNYEIILHHLTITKNYKKIKNILTNQPINIYKQLPEYNNNSLYIYFIIHLNERNELNMLGRGESISEKKNKHQLLDFIQKKYKISREFELQKNSLGLTYRDYVNNPNLIY